MTSSLGICRDELLSGRLLKRVARMKSEVVVEIKPAEAKVRTLCSHCFVIPGG